MSDESLAAIDQEVARRLEHNLNHDIYEKRLTAKPPVEGFDYIPRCIYFYYVRIDRDGRVRVDHYFEVDGDRDDPSTWKPIPHAAVPAFIRRLAVNGRPGDRRKDPPRLRSRNFAPIPWNRKAYIAIFFDEANWKFHQRLDGLSSVVFDPVRGLPNDSFFDGKDIEIEMSRNRTGDTDSRSAVYFVNHMQGDWGGGARNYKFDMWLKATFAESSDTGMSVNFDPGGTNQGPPTYP